MYHVGRPFHCEPEYWVTCVDNDLTALLARAEEPR